MASAILVLAIAATHLATTPLPAPHQPTPQNSRLIRNGFETQPPTGARPASARDVEGMLRLAQWAVKNGVTEEAEQLYRIALHQEPDNRTAWESLHALSEQRALKPDAEKVAAAKQALSRRFRTFETAHFVVLSDADSTWARRQGDRLERTWHQFQRFTERHDLRPHPLRHKLLCILFEHHQDYVAFARAHDAVQELWIAGYYSPVNDRIVFYNVESSPEVLEARTQLDEMYDEVDAFREQLRIAVREHKTDEARLLRSMIGRYKSHLAAEEQRLDDFTRNVTAATTIHEATHQLFFHTNIQSVTIEYPFWISEGLATSFETDEPNAAFGPDVEYDARRDGFQTARDADLLVPLRSFITQTSPGSRDTDEIAAMYNQSYALLNWLERHRGEQLRSYLVSMLKRDSGRPTAKEHLAAFEAAFGPVETLEHDWLSDEDDAAISIATANEPVDIH